MKPSHLSGPPHLKLTALLALPHRFKTRYVFQKYVKESSLSNYNTRHKSTFKFTFLKKKGKASVHPQLAENANFQNMIDCRLIDNWAVSNPSSRQPRFCQ